MIDISPDEIDSHFTFFDFLDQTLLIAGASQKRAKNSKATSINIIKNDEKSKNPEKTARQYQRAKQGYPWLDDYTFWSIIRILGHLNCPKYLLDSVKSRYYMYSKVRDIAKNSNYWAGSYLSIKSLENRMKKLSSPHQLVEVFSSLSEFEKFLAKITNSGVLLGDQGASLNNVFVCCEYVCRNCTGTRSLISKNVYDQILLKLTRLGAYMSQTVGQWERFSYFRRRTEALKKTGNNEAKIISLEHSRHWDRYNRITGRSSYIGSAAKSLQLSMDIANTNRLQDIDLTTLVNSVDEYAEIGYSSQIAPPELNGLKIETILDTIKGLKDDNNLSRSQKVSVLLVEAEQANSNGDYDSARNLLNEASFENSLSNFGSHERSILFIRGKIAAAQGNLNNEYFSHARLRAQEAGAIHIIKDIDNRMKNKVPYK